MTILKEQAAQPEALQPVPDSLLNIIIHHDSSAMPDYVRHMASELQSLRAQAAEPPRVPLTDEQCDAIYDALDSFGREADSQECGLPYCISDGETLAKPIARNLIRQAAHGITTQGDGNEPSS